jgi:peptidoglycan/xylan/chitin deacetylase (PgdA/CDA1 family)
MNKYFIFFLSIFISIVSCTTTKNTTPQSDKKITPITDKWEIATWKNFSKSAITHTWDDNTAKQLTTAMPIYDEFNLKMTFFVANIFNPNWIGFKKASENGHEIASHTLTHTSFATQTPAEISKELSGSQNNINEKLGNKNCLTMAYPFCVSENSNLTEKFFIAARICDGKIVPKVPVDFMKISSFIFGKESPNKTAAHFNAIADQAVSENGWAVYLFHGIDNDGGYSPIESAELRNHLQYLDANKEKFWVATFVNVTKYIKERQAAIIQPSVSKKNLIAANLTDNLDNAIYNYPVTLKKEIPISWNKITVKQKNTPIDFKIITVSAKKYAVINAIPNAGEIQIRNK